jgi:hypothetical protein
MTSEFSEEVSVIPGPLPTGDRVDLTDLEVIQRWSLAVRGASAERSEVLAALRADLAWLEGRRAPVSRSAPARKPPARKPAAKPAAKKTSSGRRR